MRLFKNSQPEREGGPQPEQETARQPYGPETLREGPLLARWYMLLRLKEEMERARRYDRPLSILTAVPALLPGEQLSPEAFAAATEAALRAARSTDLLGWLDNDSILVIMPETSQAAAEAVVFRWRNEMWLCSRGVYGKKWKIIALDPAGLETAEAFIEAATQQLASEDAA